MIIASRFVGALSCYLSVVHLRSPRNFVLTSGTIDFDE